MESVKSRRDAYAAETRQALLDAAAEAFASRGFAASSISEIAAAARVTKGALYHHFPDKRALFEEVLNQCDISAQETVLGALAAHSDDLWKGVLAAVEATLDVCVDPVAGRLIYLEGPIGLGWTRWRECETEYVYGNVRVLVQTLVDAGIYASDTPIDATTQLLAGMITHAGMALAEAPAASQKQVRRDIRTALQRVLEGLRAP